MVRYSSFPDTRDDSRGGFGWLAESNCRRGHGLALMMLLAPRRLSTKQLPNVETAHRAE